jgi:hypothetical protein
VAYALDSALPLCYTSVREEPEILQLLIVKMSIAQSAEEAKQYLLEIDQDE